jgi:hypothetical protein
LACFIILSHSNAGSPFRVRYCGDGGTQRGGRPLLVAEELLEVLAAVSEKSFRGHR